MYPRLYTKPQMYQHTNTNWLLSGTLRPADFPPQPTKCFESWRSPQDTQMACTHTPRFTRRSRPSLFHPPRTPGDPVVIWDAVGYDAEGAQTCAKAVAIPADQTTPKTCSGITWVGGVFFNGHNTWRLCVANSADCSQGRVCYDHEQDCLSTIGSNYWEVSMI